MLGRKFQDVNPIMGEGRATCFQMRVARGLGTCRWRCCPDLIWIWSFCRLWSWRSCVWEGAIRGIWLSSNSTTVGRTHWITVLWWWKELMLGMVMCASQVGCFVLEGAKHFGSTCIQRILLCSWFVLCRWCKDVGVSGGAIPTQSPPLIWPYNHDIYLPDPVAFLWSEGRGSAMVTRSTCSDGQSKRGWCKAGTNVVSLIH